MRARDGKTVSVKSFQKDYRSHSMFFAPGEGKECVLVSVLLENSSKDEWIFPLFGLSVVDDAGQKYSMTLTCGDNTDVDVLVAGGRADAMILFEVRKDAPLNFTFEPKPNPLTDEVYQTALQ